MTTPSISPWVRDHLVALVFDLVKAGQCPPSMELQNKLATLADMAAIEYTESPDFALSSVVAVGQAAVDLFVYAVSREDFMGARDRLSDAMELHMALRGSV